MHPLIEANREAIVELCRRHHVKRLDVFGSAATGDFDPATSDVDFLVEFEALEPVPYKRAYFALLGALSTLLGRSIDLLTPPSLSNRYLAASVQATRARLYG